MQLRVQEFGVSERKYRVALYSPGMVGFGHIRRNASIALALRQSILQPAVMMIAEARQAGVLPMPDGVDSVTLPALRKAGNGWITARFLDVAAKDVVALRAKVISRAVTTFEPDVLIVDHLPLGAARELMRTLEHVRKRGTTRCVLGMRDVLQDPETVNHTWSDPAYVSAIRNYYDAIWVYSDPAVWDPIREYRLFDRSDELAAKVRYTGYLDQRPRLDFAGDEGARLLEDLPPGRLAVCLVGGGQDGATLAEAFVRAEFPADTTAVVMTGPYMAVEMRRRLRGLARRRPQLKLLEFVPEPISLISRADRVIAMGGYNTICEVLSLEKHALIVPRVKPKPEQWIRAQRMRQLGLIDVLHPDQLTARALTEWLARDLGPPPPGRSRVDFGGLTRIPGLLAEVMGVRTVVLALPLAARGS